MVVCTRPRGQTGPPLSSPPPPCRCRLAWPLICPIRLIHHLTARPPPPPAGVYLHGPSLERAATYTGRHVEAGHKGTRHAPEFDKAAARPGSAPARQRGMGKRPMSAAYMVRCLRVSVFQGLGHTWSVASGVQGLGPGVHNPGLRVQGLGDQL